MKTGKERLRQLKESLVELGDLDIVNVKPTICTPYGDDLSQFGFERVEWAPMIWQGDTPLPDDHPLLKESRVFSIGLSSVLACLQLQLKARDKLLDMCAAPGVKSLYLQLLYNKKIQLYVNDLSHDRLLRVRRLFDLFDIPQPTYSNQPGQSLLNKFDLRYFDAIIIDAPCSGEGTIFEGDESALNAWSPAKVKRLAQLQRKLIIAAQKLATKDGQIIYSTCTLNMHENERTIKKAGIIVTTTPLPKPKHILLTPKTAIRLLPSQAGIGFFVAKIT